MKDFRKAIACAISGAVLVLAVFYGKKLLTEMNELNEYLEEFNEDWGIL